MQKQLLVTLYNGNTIPQIGYGTYQLKGKECVDGVKAALEVGYRHIDSASCYRNGKDIRFAREEVFITSKIAPNEQGYENAIKACHAILKDLDIQYLDLLLIHWPGAAGQQPNSIKNAEIRLQTWKALEKLLQDGLVKNIGVSNFLKKHLEPLIKACQVKPAINQIEIHPLGWDVNTVEYCQQNNIAIEAYSPLARQDQRLLQNPTITSLADKYKRSIAQISLRWALQKGFIILPKSKNPKYIKENYQIQDFNIDLDDMKAIDKLNQNIHTCWDPETIL